MLSLTVFSEIRHGTATLEYDYGTESLVDFDAGTVEIRDVDMGTYDFFHDCETSFGSFDLIMCDGAVPTCAFPCRDFGSLGSSRPFYRLNAATDFSEPLPIGDTAIFNRVDSLRYPDSKPSCLLPCYTIEKNSAMQSGGYSITLIMLTDQNRYALVFVEPFTATVESDELGYTKEFTILQGCRISWFLQDDGSTDFSGFELLYVSPKIAGSGFIRERKIPDYSVRFILNAVALKGVSNMFTLRGCKLRPGNAPSLNNLIVIQQRSIPVK
jgi:hypothetical protein